MQANIFFIIASIGVVVFTILTCLLLYQLIRIAKLVRQIVERVEAGSEVLAEDLDNLRDNLNPKRLISFIMSLMPGGKPRRRKAAKRSK